MVNEAPGALTTSASDQWRRENDYSSQWESATGSGGGGATCQSEFDRQEKTANQSVGKQRTAVGSDQWGALKLWDFLQRNELWLEILYAIL